MNDWQPKDYRRRNPHRIWAWGSHWFVNYVGDEIFKDCASWQDAMDFLNDELAKQQPMEVS